MGGNCEEELEDVVERIERGCDCVCVQSIGRTAVFYRERGLPEIKPVLIELEDDDEGGIFEDDDDDDEEEGEEEEEERVASSTKASTSAGSASRSAAALVAQQEGEEEEEEGEEPLDDEDDDYDEEEEDGRFRWVRSLSDTGPGTCKIRRCVAVGLRR